MESAMEIETSDAITPNNVELFDTESTANTESTDHVELSGEKTTPKPQAPSQVASEKESTSEKVPSSEEIDGERPSVSPLSSLFSASKQLPAPKRSVCSALDSPKPAIKKHSLDYKSMSTGVYLDATVVPILHASLVTLDRLRPADPLQFLIDYLLRHKTKFSNTKQQPPSSSTSVSSSTKSVV